MQTLGDTASLLVKEGIRPLLNIEEKYLLAARWIPEIRRRFFEDIQTVLVESELGFSFAGIETADLPEQEDGSSSLPQSPRTAKAFHLPDDVKVGATQPLSRWVVDAFSSPQASLFLDFWRQLLYVESDRSRLHLQQFHQTYRRDIQKLAAQRQLLQDLQRYIQEPQANIAQWAVQFIGSIHHHELGHDTFLMQQLNAVSAQLRLKNQAAEQYLSENSPSEKRREQRLVKMLETSFGLEQDAASHFLLDIAHRLRQPHLPHDPQSLEPLLNTALDNLVIHANNPQAQTYWQDICRGLMALGANPLRWMDQCMTGKTLVAKDEAPAFYLICQQAVFILSATVYRARFLPESSFLLGSQFDALVSAIEVFGLDLYHRVVATHHWWGRKERAQDARLERATLFWALTRWLYLSLHEQQPEPNAERLLNAAYQQYRNHFDQGSGPRREDMDTRLDAALKAYRTELPHHYSLRAQQAKAIGLDLTRFESTALEARAQAAKQEKLEAEAKLRALQEQQQACLRRDLRLRLANGDKLNEWVPAVARIHDVDEATVKKELEALIATETRQHPGRGNFFKPAGDGNNSSYGKRCTA